ncbi:MAG: restriction endonuclease subunit S [Methanomassiliicoccales archaeon]|nr:restriction endonuclease subunit S [Methanomassiliicoccales archaeon]
MASEPLAAVLQAAPRRFRPYPKYKATSVEGLGDIPAHWQVRRLKTVARVQLSNVDKKSVEGDVPVRLCNYVDVYYNDHITSAIEFMSATATPEQRTRFSLRRGDVLITKDSESWTDIAVSAVVAEDLEDVVCGYHLAHIRPLEVLDGRFLARAFSAVGPRDQFQIAANGVTRFGLSSDAIKDGVFAVPPLSEQLAIAAFLDRETAKIDTLVAKNKRVIELLQEKRTALITRGVTKGLDPSVPTKDSGVAWLGEIPEHWEVRRIAMAVQKITNGYVGPTRDIFVNEGVRYLQSLHIKGGAIDFERRPYYVTELWSRAHDKSVLREGDVLVVQTGDIGQVCAVPPEFVGSNCHALIIIQMKPHLGSGVFLSLLLQSDYGQNALRWSQTGALHPHLECGHVREIPITLPPPSEQDEIVRELDQQTAEIGRLVAMISDGIDRLAEFRAALISGAVTGRIDVREDAA